MRIGIGIWLGSTAFIGAGGGDVTAPTITSPATASIAENEPFGLTLAADEDVTWTKTGGADAALFTLAGSLLTMAAKDYDAPADADADNAYVVQVTATDGAGNATNQTITATVQAVTPQLAGTATAGSSALTDTATTINVAHTVPQGANRILVVQVVFADASDDTNGPISVTWDGAPLTRADADPYYYENGTNGSDNQLWYLLSPAVGAGTIAVTRTSAVSVRPAIHAANLVDMAQQAPHVERTTNATLTATTGAITVPGDDQLVLMAVGMHRTQGDNVLAPSSGWTQIVQTAATGSFLIGLLAHRTADAGPISGGPVLTGGTGQAVRYNHILLASFKGVPHQTQDPIYYVDAARADDSGDGLSEATAFKTLSAVEALNPQQAGTRIKLKGGQYHRLSAGAAVSGYAFTLSAANGTVSQPVVLERFGTGIAYVSGDRVIGNGTAVTGASAFANANGEKYTIAGLDAHQFPCVDGTMCHPAQWSPSGYLSSISAWDETNAGSSSVAFLASGQVQASGTAYDATKTAQYSGSGPYNVQIVDPAIGTHYGSDSPATRGAHLIYRTDDANTTVAIPIDYYDQATGTIRVSGVQYKPHPTGFFWAIRFHPQDVQQAGQYARSGDDLIVAWPAGTVKSVVRHGDGALVTGNYIQIGDDIGFCRVAADAGSTKGLLEIAGSHGTIGTVRYSQAINPDRPSCLEVGSAGGADWTFARGIFEEANTHSGYRFTKMNGATISGMYARDLGRTVLYSAATVEGNTQNIVASNIDANEHLAIHGNFESTYQASKNITISKFASMGSAQPVTSQVNPAPVADKNIRLTNYIIAGGRDTTTTVPGTYSNNTALERLDGGDTGSSRDQFICVLPGGQSGIFFGVDGSNDNAGMVVERGVVHSITDQAGGLAGVTLKDLLILTSPSGYDEAGVTAKTGIAPVNCTFLGGSSGDVAAGINGQWNGCPTSLMVQKVTANDARTGYQDVQIGPDKWGRNADKGPWIIKAYDAASYALSDLWITTDQVSAGHQAGRAIGHIAGGARDGALSLPAGLTSNDLFGIDRGVIFPLANLAAGSYSLTVRETNSGASNGPSRDTVIVITAT